MVYPSARNSWSLRGWVGQTALRIDDGLRLRKNVCEYTDDPQCVFRIQITEAQHDILFSDGAVVRTGDRLISLHLWNEHIPAIPPDGPTFAWGRRMGRAMDVSLRQLATFMSHRPEFDRVVAIRGDMAESTAQTAAQLLRIMQHFGFEPLAQQRAVSWSQRLHQFGENILVLLLLLAVNPVAARINVLSRVRFEVFLSRESFTKRYGHSALANCTRISGEPSDKNRASDANRNQAWFITTRTAIMQSSTSTGTES
jgi:hypothetical protein